MSALKDQMASMMEAMLGMKRLIESIVATAAAASTAAEADPILSSTANLAHQLAPDMVGKGRDTLGNTNSPHLGYNRSSYPYGLPPNFTPPAMHENMDHATPPTFEGQPPSLQGASTKTIGSVPKGTSTPTLLSLLRGWHPMRCLNPTSQESLNPTLCNHYSSSWEDHLR